MAKKEDRRIRKSRQLIKEAFIDLMHEKGFRGISVYDIADKADINRGTFYLHYQDKFDLFEKYVDELLNELIATIEISNQEKETLNKQKMRERQPYVEFFKHFQEHACFYEAMFKYQGDTYFYNRFIDIFKNHFCQEIKKLRIHDDWLKVDKAFLIHSMVYAHLGSINYWIENGMSDSAETMGEQLNTLLCAIARVGHD
ncbi:TetR/AcrR family transcriptional regulator [Lentibacillus jeotgali]|uniref:TetR/AcrR family transcriptional regulator n=1 Tax=Lentibacillus jeotgali TaxID=558169 RepID=UPI0002628B95|nr:TetR/AcrR family transcriptional regulator [Lentibacillus jeotgali]